MEEFRTIQEQVLWNLARLRKISTLKEIKEATGNTLKDKQIIRAIHSLKKRKLIMRTNKGINNGRFGLNPNKLYRMKTIFGDKWNSSWDIDWKKEMEGKGVY